MEVNSYITIFIRLAPYLFLSMLFVGIDGCMYFPEKEHLARPYSRGNIGEELRGKINVGKTSRVDVMFLLGAPEHASTDESKFIYEWKTQHGSTVLLPKLVIENYRYYILFIAFDTNGIVSEMHYRVAESVRDYTKIKSDFLGERK